MFTFIARKPTTPDSGANDLADTVRDERVGPDVRSFARSCQTNLSSHERTNVLAASLDTVIGSNMAPHYSFATEAPLGRGNAA